MNNNIVKSTTKHIKDNIKAYVHPEDNTSNYNADDLRRWAKKIYGMVVEGK